MLRFAGSYKIRELQTLFEGVSLTAEREQRVRVLCACRVSAQQV
jgi:hypothetical protein